MATTTQCLIRLRALHGHHPHPLRRFSSSSDTGPPSEPKLEQESQSQPTSSSYFTDVKASLQNEPSPQNRPQTLRKPNPPPSRSAAYLDEIRRNLSEFRNRSAPVPQPPSVSLRELYNKHASPNNEDSSPPISDSLGPIRDSLRHLRSPLAGRQTDPQSNVNQFSLSRFTESLKLKPGENAGGGSSINKGVLLQKESGDDVGSNPSMRTQLVRMYDYSELGAKLKMLRPEKKKGNWFSLHELNERLSNLKLIEERESKAETAGGVSMYDMRDVLFKLTKDQQQQQISKKRNMQRLDILGHIGGTPSFMLQPPKDHLVEKYFHPDNMSSAEKLKLELKKVRDEFKMTESDCGSARVQVAQLSTKIKHLSSVLKKKDKHSRRGLEAMLDRRRNLLKYLRRTDWDSYCLVLSKFGIRDNNPEIKPPHKNKA